MTVYHLYHLTLVEYYENYEILFLKDNIDEWFSSFLSSINVVVVCEYKFHLRNKRISQNERPFYSDC